MLAPREIEEYLIRIHFGKGDPLSACVAVAYADVQRTIRGVSRYEQRKRIPKLVEELVAEASRVSTQEDFDRWHEQACGRLIAAYRDIGYARFTIGHAQKWLNMTLKYACVLGADRLPEFKDIYDFCHVPFDNILLETAAPYGFAPLPCAWSALDDYAIYLARQKWFRERFAVSPLVAEFRLWLGQPVPLRSSA